MDANKAQLPTESWDGWTGVKLVDKWRQLRGPLTQTKARVERTGNNDPDSIPILSRGGNGVPHLTPESCVVSNGVSAVYGISAFLWPAVSCQL